MMAKQDDEQTYPFEYESQAEVASADGGPPLLPSGVSNAILFGVGIIAFPAMLVFIVMTFLSAV